MNEGEKLSTILGVLGDYWNKFTSDMTGEQLVNLRDNLLTLESDIKTAKNINEINEVSRNFFETLTKLEQLKFLEDIYITKLRGGNLPELEEEIRIKIINYCIQFQDKIKASNFDK